MTCTARAGTQKEVRWWWLSSDLYSKRRNRERGEMVAGKWSDGGGYPVTYTARDGTEKEVRWW